MTNLMNIQYGTKVCQLPKSLVNNEEFMKEIVSANVWNNKLKKSDKMNLLKYLPSFQQNDTYEKKETLKKLFLGKPINFENQIKRFVRCAKEGQFTPAVKLQKVLDLILTERGSRLALLRRRVQDLARIVETKKSMGIEITVEESKCLAECGHIISGGDPLAASVDARFSEIMERVTMLDPDQAKKRTLYHQYDDHVTAGHTSFRSLSFDDVVNRYQTDNDTGPVNETVAVGPMTRKRRQMQNNNGYDAGLSKYAKMKWDKDSSESQSGSSNDEKSNTDDSGTSDTDSVASTNQRRIRHNRHERREFRCPQEDLSDFFSLLQRLFLGAHQQRLTSGQVEERVRHWQTVNQRQISDEYNGWVNSAVDWVALVVSALMFLTRCVCVERRPKSQWWHWRAGEVSEVVLSEWYREWRGLGELDSVRRGEGEWESVRRGIGEHQTVLRGEAPHSTIRLTHTQQLGNHRLTSVGTHISPLSLGEHQTILRGEAPHGTMRLTHTQAVGNHRQIPAASIRSTHAPSVGTHSATSIAPDSVIAPALFPTQWRVRPSTPEERLLFQSQERRRFARPYRAFMYNVHGYNCAVSPIRGCLPGRDYSGVRARGHALLLPDRPPHVTIVEIVRDAVARLPNGEGSRAEIVTLAMDSAYWTDPLTNERTIGQCISSALDRLQGEGCDPSVKYNARLKLWFYRHRGKSVDELEEMHLRNCREEMRRGRESMASASEQRMMRPMLMSGPTQSHIYHSGVVPPAMPTHAQLARPSYQQFSRAVTSARDNIMMPPIGIQRHLMHNSAASSSIMGQASFYQPAANSSLARDYHNPPSHFYY